MVVPDVATATNAPNRVMNLGVKPGHGTLTTFEGSERLTHVIVDDPADGKYAQPAVKYGG